MKKLSKNDRIKLHFTRSKTLTMWQCTMIFRTTKLGARIYDMEQDGWRFDHIKKKGKDCRFVEYKCTHIPAAELKRLKNL
jgi:hypothetical protein